MKAVAYGLGDIGNDANRKRAEYLPRCNWLLSRGQRSASFLFALLLAATAALPGDARAGETSSLADSSLAVRFEDRSGWQFSASPYLWMAGVQGKVRQFNSSSVRIKSDFGQIFNELDYAFMGIIEGRRGRYSIFADVAYTKTSAKGSMPEGSLAEKIGVTSQSFSGLLGGGYTVQSTDRLHLDLIAGVRIWSVSTELNFQGGILDHVKPRDSATWVDMVAGVRGTYFFADKVYFTGWGNIGAGQANLDWDVAAGVGYKIKNNLSAMAGYRIQGVDYRKNGFEFDVIQKGPIVGITYRF
ncbi:hypothetical protein [Pollutimonas bauzanensis]|uniref:hypothetical protein n=1 Tax=Pollutimonas bauzanensis TaxID=658167 RepID=UPI0033421745